MNINLIGVPIFFGSDKKGVELGPNKLREKNIVNVIRNHNHKIFDLGNLHVDDVPDERKFSFHPNMKYLEPIIETNRNLAHFVFSSLKSGSFPFIVGGDHSLGLGSISGASKYFDNLAVIWVDAHGDINTYETSPSGNVHGMPLAAAMGYGYDELTNLYYEGKKVKSENVFLIGARDLDAGEQAMIKNMNLNVYSTEDIKNKGIESIMNSVYEKLKSNNVSSVHLSFDIDCLDSSLVPGTGTPASHGMDLAEGKYLIKSLMESKLVKSMDLVELNPLLDKEDTTANLVMELIDYTFTYLNK